MEKTNDIKYIQNIIQKHPDEIQYGSGGSISMIITNEKDNKAYKIQPLYYNQNNGEITERKIQNILTREHYPHIAQLLYFFEIDLCEILPTEVLTLDDQLMQKNKKLLPITRDYNKYVKIAQILVMSYYPFNLWAFIQYSYEHITELIYDLERVVFQLVYTLSCINKKHIFVHNDLFTRNLLYERETSFTDNDVVEYIIDEHVFYIPANGINIKISDFGYSVIDTVKHEIMLPQISTNNKKRDLYTFFYDLYKGSLDKLSIVEQIDIEINKTISERKIKKYMIIKGVFLEFLSKYFKFSVIDKIKNKTLLHWTWNIEDSKILQKTIKEPEEYLHLFKQFLHKKNRTIVKSYRF